LQTDVLDIKLVLILSANFVSNIFRSKKNSVTYYHKCKKCLHVKYPLLLSDFNEN
jgi:hypothetical protein